MRLPIPPAWRELLRGEPWTLAAIAAGLLGGAWYLSPAATAERLRHAHTQRVGRPPNATGRALGYSAGVLASPPLDPLEVLTMRAAAMRAGTRAPHYRAGRKEYFRDYVHTPRAISMPITAPHLGSLAAQQPVRGVSVQASPGVSRTANDVLAAQLHKAPGR